MTVVQAESPITTILQIAKLPAFPAVAVKLMQMLALEDVPFPAVAKLLATDASFSAEVLRAANSPLFGMRTEATSILQAMATLGLNRVNMLVVTTALWRSMPGHINRQLLRAWWRHNLATAFLAKHLEPNSSESGELTYMAGLMHSVGQLALLGAFPAEYPVVLTQAADGKGTVAECEIAKFGVDHCELGGTLMERWRVPAEIADAARYHHNPAEARFRSTPLVHASCCAAGYMGHAVFGKRTDGLEFLPDAARAIVENAELRATIDEKINAIESSLL
jgi:HD-like signal output (HDOD) protein